MKVELILHTSSRKKIKRIFHFPIIGLNGKPLFYSLQHTQRKVVKGTIQTENAQTIVTSGVTTTFDKNAYPFCTKKVVDPEVSSRTISSKMRSTVCA